MIVEVTVRGFFTTDSTNVTPVVTLSFALSPDGPNWIKLDLAELAEQLSGMLRDMPGIRPMTASEVENLVTLEEAERREEGYDA